MIDLSSDFGKRVNRRLQEERIIWLTTVDRQGRPQTRPVWFLWESKAFWIFSRPETAKIRHILQNPAVSLNLDGDGQGGDIVVINGRAELVNTEISEEVISKYIDKYQWGLRRINLTPQAFSESYSTALRVIPEKVRGH